MADNTTLNGAIQEAHLLGQALLNNPCQDTYGRYRGAVVNVQAHLHTLGQDVTDFPETVQLIKLVMSEGKL